MNSHKIVHQVTRHKRVWFRSYQWNRPHRPYRKVLLRPKRRHGPSKGLIRLLRCIRRIPGRHPRNTYAFDDLHTFPEPISLGQRILLRGSRRLPARDIMNLHELYRQTQASASELFQMIAGDAEPTSSRSVIVRYAIRHRFQR